ncbi:MAG: host specificity protein J [Limnohabitans sp.]
MTKKIHGAGGGGGGGGGGGNQTVVVNQNVPVYNPTYTSDDPGLRSTSFAQLQFLVCEGDVEGPAYGNTIDGLEKSVFLDDTPIKIGTLVTPQPTDLVFSYGRPNGQQTAVPGYNRIGAVNSVDTAVLYQQPVSQTVTASDPNATYYARVLLTFGALVYQTNKGDVLGTSVALKIDYTDGLGVARTAYDSSISGKFSGQFQREFEFLLQGPGPWRITVYRNTADDDDRSSDGNTYRTNFNFSTVVAVIDQKLSYPYSSVLSVGLRADQYSNLPQVSIEMKGLKIEVPSNYDPVARTYTGDWDGTFKTAYSNNPAWVLRDLIVNDRYGLGSYVSAAQVDRWTLYSIAQYCDQQVPAPGGGTEPRFTCNLILQTSEEAWNVLQQLSSIFRGLLYYAGGRIISIQDRPTQTVFTFSESNTIEEFSDDGKVSLGNFSYAGAAKRARHTVVLASWDDPLDNYQPRVEYIADEAGISRYGYKAMDLRLFGVTSRGQALRAANWALLSEAVLDDTVSFRSNEIGAAVRPGDVVAIADPAKAGRRYGGRIKAVAGNVITLDDAPTAPPTGWTGATFSYMVADAQGQPKLQVRQIVSIVGAVVTLTADATAAAPIATFPWMLEASDKSAQRFRVLTVEEQDEGVYAFTALRYRDDIYQTVDFDTPLQDNEDYLYKAVKPGAPTITKAQVIWDNNQAKLDIEWTPASTNTVLNGFDLTVKEHRLQYQSGSLQSDGSILYDGVWRELERQGDTREQIPIDQFVATDRFRVRVCAVGRLGLQSDWATRDVDDVQVWFPMPDLAGTHLGLVPGDGSTDPAQLPNAVVTHLNQSSGSQLFTWQINVPVPPYVNGVAISAKPNRTLTDVESNGLLPPDADGYYAIASVAIDDYYALAFHALVNWDVRINLTTSIAGLAGTTYAHDGVDRAELVPPIPQQFVVVTDPPKPSQPIKRRFSWDFTDPPAFVDKWPLGYVNDIVAYDIRFKAGTTVDWDLGFQMFSDGIPGDQQWFETELFDSGSWVIMLRSRDRTGWLSDDISFVKVNLGDALPTNVVDRTDLKPLAFPGTLANATRVVRTSGLMYPDPQADAFYQNPQDDEFYEGAAGNNLVQTDPTLRALYIYPFSVTQNGAGIVVYTQSSGTYQWFLKKTGGTGDDLFYRDPLTDPIYPLPITDYFYRKVSAGLTEEFHPLAPFEKVDAGTYELACGFHSVDGIKAAEIWDVDIVLDYPDIVETFNDEVIPVGGRRLTFSHQFEAMKAISLTLQDTPAPGVPQVAMVSGKDRSGFMVRCYDTNGNDVEGLVDATCVGY